MNLRTSRAKRLLTFAMALFAVAALPAAPHAAAAPADLPLGPVGGLSSAPQVAAPDLHVTLETVRCGASTRDVVAQVRNEGSLAAGSFSVILDAGWQQRQYPVSALAIGQQVSFPAITVNYSIDLVARIGPGTSTGFFLPADPDPSDDSATNTMANAGCPLPDLRVTVTTRSGLGTDVRIENIGTGPSPATKLRASYSLGPAPDEFPVPSLAPGASTTLNVWCQQSLGSRYEVDPDNSIFELNESNNSDFRAWC